MTDSKHEREAERLGMSGDITRRDFIGSSLIGSGAALLTATAPGLLRTANAQTMPVPLTGLGPEWTGPGGVGDYARSNGNTHEVVNAAHAMRNGDYATRLRGAADTGETYDLVIVGAGFAGLASAYRWHKLRPNDRVLLFDAHPIFGGEAKQNEFEVDGGAGDGLHLLDDGVVAERVTGDEVYGRETGPGRGQQHLGDVARRAFGRAELGVGRGLGADHVEQRVGHAAVVHHVVGPDERLVRPAGEQARVAGARADERDVAGGLTGAGHSVLPNKVSAPLSRRSAASAFPISAASAGVPVRDSRTAREPSGLITAPRR